MQFLALDGSSPGRRAAVGGAIHTRYGFDGSLASGVPMFGYLAQPLVRTYGAAWLQRGVLDLLFIKPAHPDTLLKIETENLGQEFNQRSHLTQAWGEDQQLVAKLESWLPASLPAVSPLAERSDNPLEGQHHTGWEELEIRVAAPRHLWAPIPEINRSYVNVHQERASCYAGEEGLVHPDYLMDACNRALMALFDPPICINTASRLVLRGALRVGRQIELRCVPLEKWERRGHRFARFYLALWDQDQLVAEIEHSVILQLAH